MIRIIGNEVLAPLGRRAGTLIAGALVGLGAAEPAANAVGLGVAALVGVSLDLLNSYLERRGRN